MLRRLTEIAKDIGICIAGYLVISLILAGFPMLMAYLAGLVGNGCLAGVVGAVSWIGAFIFLFLLVTYRDL